METSIIFCLESQSLLNHIIFFQKINSLWQVMKLNRINIFMMLETKTFMSLQLLLMFASYLIIDIILLPIIHIFRASISIFISRCKGSRTLCNVREYLTTQPSIRIKCWVNSYTNMSIITLLYYIIFYLNSSYLF